MSNPSGCCCIALALLLLAGCHATRCRSGCTVELDVCHCPTPPGAVTAMGDPDADAGAGAVDAGTRSPPEDCEPACDGKTCGQGDGCGGSCLLACPTALC